ncbi:MAG: hypothetical protein LUG90_06145 [Clostridiaceae bacterium]|nr:hypothetical protein [Clostridiaceae bacterium]
MKHFNSLAALALSVSMGISGCALAPASSASSETVSSTYEKNTENTEIDTIAETAETVPPDSQEHAPETPEESTSETETEAEAETEAETEAERAAAFAQKIKKAVAAADMEELADLCGYPVCITLESGDGRELETREDFTALGADTLFTQKVKDTIAAVQESELEFCGAGVMMGENGTIVFHDVNGTMMITGINLSD